jgi:uncharacterized protein
MTPQETGLVTELFDRLAKLESAPRDAGAERAIAEGLQRAPHAIYALVQTTLLQDEALKRANARIEELQAQAEGAGAPEPEQQPASFLDTMRTALGGAPARGSVPRVRAAAPGGDPQEPQANFQSQGQPQPGYPPQTPPGYPPGAPAGGGGSFLGTAASAAAGVVGGALLLDGIRSMFGHHSGHEQLYDARPEHVVDADDDDNSGDVYDVDDEDDGDDADDGDFDGGDGGSGGDSYDV